VLGAPLDPGASALTSFETPTPERAHFGTATDARAPPTEFNEASCTPVPRSERRSFPAPLRAFTRLGRPSFVILPTPKVTDGHRSAPPQ